MSSYQEHTDSDLAPLTSTPPPPRDDGDLPSTSQGVRRSSVSAEGEGAGQPPPPPSSPAYDDIVPMEWSDIKLLMHVGVASFLPSAATSAFAGLTPELLTILIGSEKTAGAISSSVAGAGALFALFATPIMSQLMDKYGRRVFGIITSLKALMIVVPLLVGGIISFKHNGGKVGEDLTGGALVGFKMCLIVWYVASFVKMATFSSQGVVAVGDIFSNGRHRAIGVSVYLATMSAGSFAMFIGASLPLMTGGIVVVSIAGVGMLYNVLFFPETCKLLISAPPTSTPPTAVTSPTATVNATTFSAVEMDEGDRHLYSPTIDHMEEGRESGTHQTTIQADTTTTSSTAVATLPQQSLDIKFCISPFAGLRSIRKDKPAVIAMLILCCYIFSEITANDVMAFYLVKKLSFTPQDLSIISVETSVLTVVANLVIVPLLTRYMSCTTIAIISSTLVVSSLALIGMASSKVLVFIAIAPSALAIITVPSLVAVITRGTSTPQEVSLVINTVMAINFALSAVGGLGGGILFELLPDPLLFLTFIIAAAFMVPMFALSVYLRVLLRREEKHVLTATDVVELPLMGTDEHHQQ